MVHPEFILDALNQGADGVMVMGCHLGECHYLEGNHITMARLDMIVELLEDLGYESERLSLTWLSSAEPDKFVRAVTEMTERVKELGPVQGDVQTV
jgi:F420-non-reducing hydrogenase iron-sulfur subunit